MFWNEISPLCKADCELRAKGWCWLALARQAEPVDPLNASNQAGGRGDFVPEAHLHIGWLSHSTILALSYKSRFVFGLGTVLDFR